MLVSGLAGSITANGKQAVNAAEKMSGDITEVMNGLASDMQTALPSDFNVNGSVTGSVGGVANGQTIIYIYPQTLDQASVDYLFTRFNARMGAAI